MSTASTPLPSGEPRDAGDLHRWSFFRTGGFDQVRIETADDLRHLDRLDQKLWAVLTVPTQGLEFDARTLQLIDADGDGRIRAPELLEAVRWVCRMLRDPQLIFTPGDRLALAALRDDDEESARLAAAARELLVHLGRPQDDTLCLADLSEPARLFAPQNFNGDGVITAELALASADEAAAQAVTLIAKGVPAAIDRSGQPGIDAAGLDAFLADAQAVLAWWAQVDEAAASRASILPLGESTADAAAALEAVREKVEDYFTRCRLAAFDPRAGAALNPSEAVFSALAPSSLSAADAAVAALPLAAAGADAALPLLRGLNPAWDEAVRRLRTQAIVPLMGELTQLSASQWAELVQRLEPWRQWQAARPTCGAACADPSALRAACEGEVPARLRALIERDLQARVAAAQVDALEKLLRLRRDLATLLRNFVNLADFYGGKTPAIFQAGTLYLDQRSCTLCLRVEDMARHASMAPLSGSFLVYCQCTRQGEAPITIVAAMTGGDADAMMAPGRNGVFYDRQGRDWHASVTRIVSNPISVRQAFWSPYRRISKSLSEQIQKLAAARDKSVDSKADNLISQAMAKVASNTPAPPPAKAAAPASFDIAKFAGIFAAVGLAVGALGTALAALLGGFLSLPVWKMPLVIIGLVALISGPSMVLAWFKLRQRNLGPLLDANGWAVNIRARLNIPFGGSLTGVAALPEGARRSLSDPFADKPVPWGRWAAAGVVLLALALWSWWARAGA